MSNRKLPLYGFSGEWDVEKVINKMKKIHEGSFFLCNLSDVLKKFDDWVEKLPRVKPFYAVSYIINYIASTTLMVLFNLGKM
jgi:hypothetical protein